MENFYFLVFDTESAANAALETIYANMVDSINSPDLLNIATGEVVDKEKLTPDAAVQVDAEKRNFPVFGVNAETRVKDLLQGYTTAWAVAQETLQGKWVFPPPKLTLLDGVTGYTLESYNPAWF
jgi:hypothetical protein